MKLLITGVCGFAGSALAVELQQRMDGLDILGIDNLSRPGSEINRLRLKRHGVRVRHGDIRSPSDLEPLPKVDWVIDAAANPSVLSGVGGQASSRQLMEHNLSGTLQLLEYCKRHGAGLLMLATSRVYSLDRLSRLPVDVSHAAFVPRFAEIHEPGLSRAGVAEEFATTAPISLYGAAKLASEVVSLEYGLAFEFPVYVNRCGVLAGAGQFGKADQGIFSFWIHSYRWKRPLSYIGFGGTGHQVRDCLHPRDLAALVALQLTHPQRAGAVFNVGGGSRSQISLAQLSERCAARFGAHAVAGDPEPRRYDVPWLVLDAGRAEQAWGWQPTMTLDHVFDEIAEHAERHADWLDLSSDA